MSSRCRALFLVLILSSLPAATRAGVMISELCDPRLNYATDRYIEIYNPDGEAVDLTGWRLVAVGNDFDVFTWTLSGLIDAQQALVAGDATTVAVFPVAFPDETWSGSTGNWNGKGGDGARLLDASDNTIDYIVATDTFFENASCVRNADISEPSPVFMPGQWTSTPVELASDATPGTHITSTSPQGPVVANIRTSPEWPAAGDTVVVLAEITDTGAGIDTVTLSWGTQATSLLNEIPMTVLSGDTYRTSVAIPAQGGGTTVYYRIEAVNTLPAATLSGLQQFAFSHDVTVAEIQGEASASPYEGLSVQTSGIVTSAFTNAYVIQDGSDPWAGVWIRGDVIPSPGDQVTLIGQVTEHDALGLSGTTMIADAQLIARTPGFALPELLVVSSAAAASEANEGVLVRIQDGVCTEVDAGAGLWRIDDGSGACTVGPLGYTAAITLGSTYAVSGPVADVLGEYRIHPRGEPDVVWLADLSAPVMVRATAISSTTLRVTFSEALEPQSAGNPGHYTVTPLTVLAAVQDVDRPEQVLLTVSEMASGQYTLTASQLTDLYGNTTGGTSAQFSYTSPDIPAGYYDDISGQTGLDLRAALHELIRNHTAYSYDYAWTAYYTTDVRPDNGKVWDIYSDIPGAAPPYLYTLGDDQGGVGGEEGTGYTREHTWCKSWFGGEVSPMYTDLFTLFPCDTHMNGTRGVYAYGETATPQFISLNGSRVGPSSVPGYTGTVFEPRDDFKGDLARAYFYFSARYYTEDAGWPGGPATDGADLRDWVLDLFLQWAEEDPVSRKEILRNTAIYLIQGNRNPFVDHPEYVELVFAPTSTGLEIIEESPEIPGIEPVYLASPNPFNPTTRISYSVPTPGYVDLSIHDLRGRVVRRLVQTHMSAGLKTADWDGTDQDGRRVASGSYILRLRTDQTTRTRKVLLAK